MSLGTIDLGSFEVLSDHGDTEEDDVVVDESSEEATVSMPPLPTCSMVQQDKDIKAHRDGPWEVLETLP